ncbi:hypothetical protein VNO78_10017 [Psophocarpus tetragonolobus]|uniref:Uncharacterized protein n=1 Tax=Psophocarpus tetragonolobus TaxID=3891 RepID=A0AAN9XMC9_PSOTE
MYSENVISLFVNLHLTSIAKPKILLLGAFSIAEPDAECLNLLVLDTWGLDHKCVYARGIQSNIVKEFMEYEEVCVGGGVSPDGAVSRDRTKQMECSATR